jgi:hypothetical protein
VKTRFQSSLLSNATCTGAWFQRNPRTYEVKTRFQSLLSNGLTCTAYDESDGNMSMAEKYGYLDAMVKEVGAVMNSVCVNRSVGEPFWL